MDDSSLLTEKKTSYLFLKVPWKRDNTSIETKKNCPILSLSLYDGCEHGIACLYKHDECSLETEELWFGNWTKDTWDDPTEQLKMKPLDKHGKMIHYSLIFLWYANN